MLIKNRRIWDLPASAITPEHLVTNRRGLIGGLGAIAGGLVAGPASAQWKIFGGPTAKLQELKPLGARPNATYTPGRDITPEKDATSYNNYYEFGTSKSVVDAAQALPTSPWTIAIDGMVKTPKTIGFDDLMKKVSLEERAYRHRCVETWAMTVPWIGFPLSELVKMAEPLGSAQYVVFNTLADQKTMPGLKMSYYPWPYTEAVTMQEAMNELSFLSVGMYGKTIPPQNGAPIRLTLPWKYGFKSVKSIVKISFTDKRPKTFWQELQDSEYGFWANVNPAVPHPRWSQARERLLGNDDMVPTQIWNGYGDYVASMYTDKKSERLFV